MGAPGCPSPVPPGVETPYFQGGPNHEPARELVERVAHELGLEPAIELIEVPDTEAATQLRFLGSPTVRVDGRDVEPVQRCVPTSRSRHERRWRCLLLEIRAPILC